LSLSFYIFLKHWALPNRHKGLNFQYMLTKLGYLVED